MTYTIIQENQFQKARNQIREAKKNQKTVVFTSNNDDLNRKVLEKEPIDVLLINQKERQDKQKQRSSGFNQVMARTAKKNNVTIGINLNEMLKSKGKGKAEILARIEQNIRLCNKSKIKMTFFPELKNNHDLKALGLVLGMPTWMTKEI